MTQNYKAPVTSTFKRMTTKAILSVLFFFFVYIFLILCGVGITALAAIGGIMIIAAKPTFITVMLGAGLLCMGILVLIFLFKFMFVKHKIDRSHLIEITREDEPKLFAFIDEIVNVVETDFPKKVYLSSDVNACVFYDSTFWSMFLPIKKNLQIGVGLVNSVSEIELKAILAHEFGHFSQKSMKVGSYVYNVNQIIHNMLYDNDSYNSIAQSWGSVNGYFAFFTALAVKIVAGIQWILQQVYNVVNISYHALSRQMEFHADAVAASVTGSKPLITSLLRLDLADHSFTTVLEYYGKKIPDSITTENLYSQQAFVMNFIAVNSNLKVENDLPQLTPEFLSRFNKSKLVIENKWGTHPSTEDRIKELERLNLDVINENNALAIGLFKDGVALQNKFTNKVFSSISYENTVVFHNNEEFVKEYKNDFFANSFDATYNKYYDSKNIEVLDLNSLAGKLPQKNLKDLFSNNAVDLIYSTISLENDINTLKQIVSGNFKIKSFSYDGHKFFAKNAQELVNELELDLKKIKEEIIENDKQIYLYFLELAKNQNKDIELNELYKKIFELDKSYDYKIDFYVKMMHASEFIYRTCTVEVINEGMKLLKKEEVKFRKQIEKLLDDAVYEPVITVEIRASFNKYLSEEWVYFNGNQYLEEVLQLLTESLMNYHFVISRTFFQTKKELLDYQVQLLKHE
ncbi:Zn-dependent protease with chaperone function [Flavobacterium nitrogenifigens]|uniref:Zn-dependent protease with chaperone function n=2 Tax=Flavobacterium TaxID=237 RepID=A0A7W7IY07_9FLAO|nr:MULTISPECIES: M48 family metallopeptidase [Flavobacterium]MBB4801945.1 Zn-dependent protease with chaperone function [Flavobacterium nitrogenifigens]MBB6386903.1 Zn-dependent protease with chaperone function [Flavobacterium notoginsengisoli]